MSVGRYLVVIWGAEKSRMEATSPEETLPEPWPRSPAAVAAGLPKKHADQPLPRPLRRRRQEFSLSARCGCRS